MHKFSRRDKVYMETARHVSSKALFFVHRANYCCFTIRIQSVAVEYGGSDSILMITKSELALMLPATTSLLLGVI